MSANKVTSFYINRSGVKLHVNVVYGDGSERIWSYGVTERGAKMCLTRCAKQHGFTVTGDTAQPSKE